MIREEYPLIMDDGEVNMGLIKHYSDKNVMMLQVETGNMYAEAIDIYPCPFTYEETDIPIKEDAADELEDAKNALNILGVN